MAELIDRDALLKKAVTIPGLSGKSVFSVVFTDDILNAESIEPTIKNDLGVLDKVRAEIDNALSDGMIHKKTVLGIIDKYKAKSEDKE